MSESSPVSQSQLDALGAKIENRDREYDGKMDMLSEKMSLVLGGITVVSFLVFAATGFIGYHTTFRFSITEKAIERIEKKLDIARPKLSILNKPKKEIPN